MSAKVVFLTQVPKVSPGLLFKVFHFAGADCFYQPLWPHLDLLVKYSVALRGDPRVPPGYLEPYLKKPELFQGYPKNSRPANTEELMPFLEQCILSAESLAVFDVSGYESEWGTLKDHFKMANFIACPGEDLFVTNYQGTCAEILESCGLSRKEIPLTSDWVKLIYQRQNLKFELTPSFCDPKIARQDLETILKQHAEIVTLTRLESEVKSLQTQLTLVGQAAEERLGLMTEYQQQLESVRRRPLKHFIRSWVKGRL